MKEKAKKQIRLTVLALLLLGTLLESMPQLHHHQEAHACAQIDGSYYYLESASDLISAENSPRAVAFRRGGEHEHEHCGLCQLVTYPFVSLETPLETRNRDSVCPIALHSLNIGIQVKLHGPRGPPVGS